MSTVTARGWAAWVCLLLVVKLVMVGIAFIAEIAGPWSAVPGLPLPVFLIGLAFVGSSLAMAATDRWVGHLSSLCVAVVTGWSAMSALIVGEHRPWSCLALATSLLLLIASSLAARRAAPLRKDIA